MTKKPVAHRAEFPVRCACGMVYNSDDSHIGKQIKCRCGNVVSVVRPADDYAAAEPSVGSASGPIGGTGARSSSRSSSGPSQSSSRSSAQSSGQSSSRSTSRYGAQASPRNAEGDRGAPAWRRHAARAVRAYLATLLDASRRELRSRRLAKRWTARVGWAWAAVSMAAWPLLIFTSERFLPATLLAYGPRFVLLLPFALLVPLAMLFARRTLLPLVAGLLVVLHPVMGGRVSLRSLGKGLPAVRVDSTVRVLTYNVEGGKEVVGAFRQFIRKTSPDIIALQECGDEMWDTLQALPVPHRLRFHGLCTASRWPITVADSMPRATYERISQYGFSGTGLLMRHLIQSPYGPLVFGNLHLTTARRGLELLMGQDGFIPDALTNPSLDEDAADAQRAEIIDLNARIRNSESERASAWAIRGLAGAPVLVAGDFNLPVESSIYRRYWSEFVDAYEASGTGFGWSKEEGQLLRIRIDHVLVSRGGPRTVGAWVGEDLGSDHLPVIADFRVRTKR